MANENGILRKRGRGRVASRNEHLLHEIRLTRSMEDLKTGCVRVRVLMRSRQWPDVEDFVARFARYARQKNLCACGNLAQTQSREIYPREISAHTNARDFHTRIGFLACASCKNV